MAKNELDKDKLAAPFNIDFKIAEIKKITFFEKDFNQYELKSADLKKGTCNIGFNVVPDYEEGTISIPFRANFYVKSGDNDFELFGIETIHRFKIKKFAQHFKKDENDKVDIPDEFVGKLLGIAVGGTRGMLVALNTVAKYNKILLPLIDTSKLLGLMKKKD